MIASFDTSVLVAALISGHQHHARAMPWIEAAGDGRLTGRCSLHAVAETWAVLTRLPHGHSVPGAVAEQMLERLARIIQPRPLSAKDYGVALRRCGERALGSGAVFDALHVAAAEASRADLLLTFNEADFVRLAAGARPKVVVPPDPPAARW